jgi:hypothetical protein
MTRRVHHLAGVLVIAPLWFTLSLILTLALAGAEDNTDMSAPVPLWLRAACSVVDFPLLDLPVWGKPPMGVSDHAFAEYAMLASLINGVFWGLLMVFLYRLVGRFIKAKKREWAKDAPAE